MKRLILDLWGALRFAVTRRTTVYELIIWTDEAMYFDNYKHK